MAVFSDGIALIDADIIRSAPIGFFMFFPGQDVIL